MKKKDKVKPIEENFTPGHPWDYQKNAGIIDFIEDSGIHVRPTHNYELLKAYQLELWNRYIIDRKKEMEFAGVTFSEGDENQIRKAFLEKEVSLFTGFIKGSNSDHDKLQMTRYIEDCQNEIEPNGKPIQAGEKIKWNGTPSQFGYLFLELVAKGFINPPLYNGESNYKGLSRQCYQYFEIKTTSGNIEKELNPDKNTLSDSKRAKFTIPDLSDMA